jgi:hypothetical protein
MRWDVSRVIGGGVVFVRRGLRPGGIASPRSRYRWSVRNLAVIFWRPIRLGRQNYAVERAERGGMGVVWRATRPGARGQVALKLMAGSMWGEEELGGSLRTRVARRLAARPPGHDAGEPTASSSLT